MKLAFHNVIDSSTSTQDVILSKKWIIQLAELNQYGVVKLKAVQLDSLERVCRTVERHVGYQYLNKLIRQRFGHNLAKCTFYDKVHIVRMKMGDRYHHHSEE